ncbi:hypothetical protein [Enterobacter phage vB_EclM_AS6]
MKAINWLTHLVNPQSKSQPGPLLMNVVSSE